MTTTTYQCDACGATGARGRIRHAKGCADAALQRRDKRQLAAQDTLIERAYYRVAQGVQINVMDIGKVFAAGRQALAAGGDLDAAVAAAVAQLRQN